MTEIKRRFSANPGWAIWSVLGLIVVLGLGLRVYRLDELVIFLGDQGRDVTPAWRMVITGEPALLGPTAFFGQFKQGPAYYYLLLSGLTAGGGNPVGAAWSIILLDSAAIVLMFIAGRRVSGVYAGLAAAGLYATAHETIYLAREFLNPGVLAFFSLLVFIALVRLVQGETHFFPIVVGACVAAWQIHSQSVLLIIWTIGVLLVFRPRLSWRSVAASALIALVLLAPFMWHEAQNEFVNLRAMAAYIGGSAARNANVVAVGATLQRVGAIAYYLQAFLPLTGVPHLLLVGAAAASYIQLLLEMRSNHNRALQVLALYGVLGLLYVIWPGPLFPIYLEIVLPIPFLVIGYGFGRIAALERRVAFAAMSALALVCLSSTVQVYAALRAEAPTLENLSVRRRVVEAVIEQSQGRPFLMRLDTSQKSEAFESPYTYLFEWLGALDCSKLGEIGFGGAYACESSAIEEPGGDFQNRHRPVASHEARVAMIANAETFWIFEPASRAPEPMRVGTLIEGIRIVRLSPPLASGEDLLEGEGFAHAQDVETWNRRARDGRIAWDADARALMLQNGYTKRALKLSRRMQLEPDTAYLVAFEFRSVFERGAQDISVLCLDAKRHFVAKFPQSKGYRLGGSADWQPGSFLMRTPPNCVQATIQLRQKGVGTSWFRGLSVRAASFATGP